MLITKDELIDLIAEQVEFDHDRVEEEVNKLIDQIHERTEAGESFEMEGFGRFYREEGRLLFDPSDDLSTELNYKYAGMEPVELAESNKDLPEEDEEEEFSETGKEHAPSEIEGEGRDVEASDASPEDEESALSPDETSEEGKEEDGELESAGEKIGAGTGEDDEDVDFEKIFGLSARSSPEEEEQEEPGEEAEEGGIFDEISESEEDVSDDFDLEEESVTEKKESDESTGDSGADEDRDIDEEPLEPETSEEAATDSMFEGEEEETEHPVDQDESGYEEESGVMPEMAEGEENEQEEEEKTVFGAAAGEDRKEKDAAGEEDEPRPEEEETLELDESIEDEETMAGASEGKKSQDKATDEEKTKKRRKTRTRRRRSLLRELNAKFPVIPLLIISVSIVVLGFGFWMITSPDMRENVGDLIYGSEPAQEVAQDKSPPSPPVQEESETGDGKEQDKGDGADQPSADEETAAEAAESDDDQLQNQSENESAEEESQPYGLYGPWNNEGTSYTLIIYSFRERSQAEEVIENMRETGYRMHIQSAIVGGNRYYRVALGQFRSIEAAQQAASELDERHRDNFFIRSISNS